MRALGLTILFLAGACASEDGGRAGSEDAVESVVRENFAAEKSKNVDAFLELWTDEGLKEYDVGTREEIASGESSLGEDPGGIHRFVETTVKNSEATTIVDATRLASQAVKPLFRLRFELIEREGSWMLNGFEFMGGPPPAEGTELIDIKGQEYAFVLEREEVPGDAAFTFANTGKEPHEITLFKGPDDLDIEKAHEDLKDVDGSRLDNVPTGYKVDHISFAEPGQEVDVLFAEEMPAGMYVLACYLPEGGFPEAGEPDPKAKPHFQLGMRSLLRVR